MTNSLTIDVEEYFHPSEVQRSIPMSQWDGLPSRVEASTDAILELLDRHSTRATFFVLGWVAERHAALVQRISSAGHEIACHSYAHQLVYSLTPDEFRADTLRLTGEIHARGRLPLLVGGTMLYYKALTQGLNDLPAADADVRATLDADAAREGWPAMHARLAAVDPATAARLAPNDSQRIQRALEVFLLTGQAMSALLAAPARPDDTAAAWRFVPIALEPSDRSVLHARIEKRFDAMLAGGFVDEVVKLRQRGDLRPEMPSMRCVGYRQVWEYLDGAVDHPTMRDKGVFATRQLCKRQLTWLRSMTERMVVDCCDPRATARVLDLIEALI